MSTTRKENRLNLPIGVLKSVLQDKFRDTTVDKLTNIAEIEELALKYASKDELSKLISLRLKNNAQQSIVDQENSISTDSRRDTTSAGDFYGQGCYSHSSRMATQDELSQDDELMDAVAQAPWQHGFIVQRRNTGSQRSVDYTDSVQYPREQQDSYNCSARLRSVETLGLRSRTSIDTVSRHNDFMLDNEKRPATQAMAHMTSFTARSPRCPDSSLCGSWNSSHVNKTCVDEWNAMTPANDISVAETPLLRPGNCGRSEQVNFAPSHFHSRGQGFRTNSRHSGASDYGRIIQNSYKSSVPRIIEGVNETDAGSSGRYVTPASSRFAGPALHTSQRNSTMRPQNYGCRPCDPVIYNEQRKFPSLHGEDVYDGGTPKSQYRLSLTSCIKWIWRWKYTTAFLSIGIWLFGIPNPYSFSALGGFSSLLPSSKSTGTLPTFCSMRRTDSRDCAPCPRRAFCYDGRAECPTYFALEKITSQEWECKSYKEELEKIAHEGFSRVISHLRKIEKPADCGTHVASHPESRRDVLHLFDNILLPMLDERQKGLKDGLLQMYLTLLADEDRLRELNVEKDGGLHVTLASVISKTRWMCYLPTNGHSVTFVLLLGIAGLIYLNFWLK